jgi:hypothetical protein
MWFDGVVEIVAHRGASSVCPENTMVSFLRAIELGADGIEFDVQATTDGQLVVIHDLSLDRTTNSRGPVFASTFETVRILDAGSWFGTEFEGEQVPTLAEVLALDGVEFELEIKGYGEPLSTACSLHHAPDRQAAPPPGKGGPWQRRDRHGRRPASAVGRGRAFFNRRRRHGHRNAPPTRRRPMMKPAPDRGLLGPSQSAGLALSRRRWRSLVLRRVSCAVSNQSAAR